MYYYYYIITHLIINYPVHYCPQIGIIIIREFNGTLVSIRRMVIERSPVRYAMPAVMLDLSSLSKNLTLAQCLGGT